MPKCDIYIPNTMERIHESIIQTLQTISEG
jgi:hypothetical protein